MVFFQAEDGIRDIGVTGVQTCALPISRPKLPVPLLTPSLSARWIGLVTPVDAGAARPLVEGLATPTAVTEIGRASCRERVLISAVAVSLKKNICLLLSLLPTISMLLHF